MKNKIAIASAFFAASSFSFAEIALTESLSVEGFVNTQYTDGNGTQDATFDLEEVEISFLFESGDVSARIDTDYIGAFGTGDLDQAFISYDVFGGTVSAGLMDSQLGFEAFEAPGLYTNTLAYSNGVNSQLPATDEGIKFTKQLDAVSSIGVALSNGGGTFIGDESNGGDTTIEVAYGRDLGNGIGAFVGFRSDNQSNDLINAYVTYETGAYTFAAEIVDGETTTDYQLLANYAYADNASVTVRYTTEEVVGGDDIDVLTLAHQLALADNLCLTSEFSDNGAATEDQLFSVSLLFTF